MQGLSTGIRLTTIMNEFSFESQHVHGYNVHDKPCNDNRDHRVTAESIAQSPISKIYIKKKTNKRLREGSNL